MHTKTPARYVMVGGFLGAGKSTALARFARRLTEKGRRVGLITNDQGAGLVDSRALRAQGFAVEEIAGGCFCCRFGSLLEAARRLAAEARPDVFLAEPVGSCTDLVATVSYPLRRIYGGDFRVAPLSVLVDPVRAARVLGLEAGGSFSRKVTYVYEKQLEEADIIAVNKLDLLDRTQRAALRRALNDRYPRAEVLEVSARRGDGLDEWFDRLEREELRPRRAIEIDYDLYAEGEALLGWLNATLRLSAPTGGGPVDGNAALRGLAERIQARLAESGAEVAHLKMTLSPFAGAIGPAELAVVNLVRQDWVPEVCQEIAEPLRPGEDGELIVNLRAESPPEVLRAALESAVAAGGADATGSGGRFTIEHLECFRPGRPVPAHRDETAAAKRGAVVR
jgi:Ni2+-binding GTPase involved in maturation of urease and hydrogenase